MSQYNDSEKQDERKEIHFIIDSIMSVVFMLSSINRSPLGCIVVVRSHHTRYQMFKSSRRSTAITDGHATWQVIAMLVTTEMHIDVAKPT